MAGKVKVKYVCNSCGYQTSQWMGRCSQCGEWNSFSEEIDEATAPKNKKISAITQSVLQGEITRLNDVSIDDEIRYKTGLSELDRVLGGGIVKGSLVLLGGVPGIGKSTLLLQICDCLCRGLKVMYFSGEESVRQIKLRADRLGVNSDNLFFRRAPAFEYGNLILLHLQHLAGYHENKCRQKHKDRHLQNQDRCIQLLCFRHKIFQSLLKFRLHADRFYFLEGTFIFLHCLQHILHFIRAHLGIVQHGMPKSIKAHFGIGRGKQDLSEG